MKKIRQALWFLSLVSCLRVADVAALQQDTTPAESRNRVTIVTLGDSITKGVRGGVKTEETFAARVEPQLKEQGVDAQVINVGIGGEGTDQALARLDAIVAHRPQVVTIMYGTNDSYVDRGQQESRITCEAYRGNLKKIVAELLLRGIEPILMTEPRWAADAKNGLDENPNVRLAPYMQACREIAAACQVPLVDHFADWTEAERQGQKLFDWTTDGCHPNPLGHEKLAAAMMPILLPAVQTETQPLPFEVKLETVLKHDDGTFRWYHPRVAALPRLGKHHQPRVVMTLQKHLQASDHYSGLQVLQSEDLGVSWSEPNARPELDWIRDGEIDIAVADVTPGWHARTKKLIAVGAQVRYSPAGVELEDQPRSHQTAYAVCDPDTGLWTKWRRLEMPAGDQFNFARSACAQFVVAADGHLLLPFYVATSASVPYSTMVVRCAFDGDQIQYREHGDVLSLDVARGLYEPSLVQFAGRYFLTIRNDAKGYVTVSDDGLHFRPIKPWLFDDGQDLGSYNTQQHWLVHRDGLFLIYTRRGANNDHIMRHRAPLFMAQVDPRRLQIMRKTERVLVPERGAELGNFGAAAINETESWVTVAEGIWNDDARQRGAEGAVFLARVIWSKPNHVSVLPRIEEKLRAAEPITIVCFGDSVTGLYYHSGGRRAYNDMLGIAMRRMFPQAAVTMVNAGISGHTTVNALARIDQDVLAQQPTLVTVMFGLNDMTRVSLDEYRENLKTIITKCRAAGAEVLLCTPNNVIENSGRPTEKLEKYCEVIREVGREQNVAVCDCYRELQSLRQQDALAWRLLMSDEIHPNADGHKRLAEQIAQAITGQPVSLSDLPPPTPALAQTASLLKKKSPVKILAMPPLDGLIGGALKEIAPDASLEIIAWPTADMTLSQMEADAKNRVRTLKPDLVLIAVPRDAKAETQEAFIRSYAWIMNWSLSFGQQEWDCVVVHPAVTDAEGPDSEYDALVRQLVAAQDLTLIERRPDDQRNIKEILREWVRSQLP